MGFPEWVDGDMVGGGKLSEEVDEEESKVKMRLEDWVWTWSIVGLGLFVCSMWAIIGWFVEWGGPGQLGWRRDNGLWSDKLVGLLNWWRSIPVESWSQVRVSATWPVSHVAA